MKRDMVKLNVGGVTYCTTSRTLLNIKGTIFEEAFSEDFEDLKCDDGSIFIDRSGELFKYVLEYLRNPYLEIPPSVASTPAFKEEVSFYKLPLGNEQKPVQLQTVTQHLTWDKHKCDNKKKS